MTDFGMLQSGIFGVELLGAFHGLVDPPSAVVCRAGMKLFDRLFYIVHGRIIFDLANAHIEAGSGSVVYLPCDCVYKSRWDTSARGEYISVNFILHDSCAAKRSIGDSMEVVIQDKSNKYLSIFKQINELWLKSEIGFVYGCNVAFWEIIRNLYVDTVTKSMKLEYDRIYQSVIYLRNNYQTDVDTDALARLCGMSTTAFRREFKLRTGTSPVKYKNSLRMEKAKSLLESGECSVTEASGIVGCPDIYYFCKLFRREYGCTPSGFMPRTQKSCTILTDNK